MKAYWDSSALVEAAFIQDLRARLKTERGFTRLHSLSEMFSTLTSGKLRLRLQPDQASTVVKRVAIDLDYVDLSPSEILGAFENARRLGVRGGRIHDYLHALAAEKCAADELLTLDKNDFTDLTTIPVRSI